jgi:hypothetical protein
MPFIGCCVQRGEAGLVSSMDIGTTGDQQFSHTRLTRERRHNQWRGVILAFNIDVHALSD